MAATTVIPAATSIASRMPDMNPSRATSVMRTLAERRPGRCVGAARATYAEVAHS